MDEKALKKARKLEKKQQEKDIAAMENDIIIDEDLQEPVNHDCFQNLPFAYNAYEEDMDVYDYSTEYTIIDIMHNCRHLVIDPVSPAKIDKEPDSTQSTPVALSKYNCAVCMKGFKSLFGFKHHNANKEGNYGCYKHYKNESKKAIKAEETKKVIKGKESKEIPRCSKNVSQIATTLMKKRRHLKKRGTRI